MWEQWDITIACTYVYIYIYENQLYIYRQKTETYIDKLFYLGRLLTQKTHNTYSSSEHVAHTCT